MIDLDELEKLERAATPAPWKVGRIKSMVWHSPAPDVWRTVADCIRVTVKSAHNHRANAKLIAAMRNAVPELIVENRKFQECTRELSKQNDFFLKTLKENFMCPYSRCKYDDGSGLQEWECDAENNRECWIKAAEEVISNVQ